MQQTWDAPHQSAHHHTADEGLGSSEADANCASDELLVREKLQPPPTAEILLADKHATSQAELRCGMRDIRRGAERS